MAVLGPDGRGSGEQTDGGHEFGSRAMVTEAAAHQWLSMHPDMDISRIDLAKTLTQLLTEVFQTGKQRRHADLSQYAYSLLEATGVDPKAFASARMYSGTADMPTAARLIFMQLAEVLSPLAAAIQLARTAVTDAAARVLLRRACASELTRRELRGFVVSTVRPHAQKVHERMGFGESTETYLRMILTDVEVLAESVVAAAIDKAARPTALTAAAAERLAAFIEEHLPRLRRMAARHRSDADEIFSMTMAKVASALCNNPDLNLEFAFVARALETSAIDLHSQRIRQAANEYGGMDAAANAAAELDDLSLVDAADTVLRHVLDVVKRLEAGDVTPEHAAARQALLQYFLEDPLVVDPRRAKLAAHVLTLPAPSGRYDELRSGLDIIVADLAPNQAAAQRISRLAIATLRMAA